MKNFFTAEHWVCFSCVLFPIGLLNFINYNSPASFLLVCVCVRLGPLVVTFALGAQHLSLWHCKMHFIRNKNTLARLLQLPHSLWLPFLLAPFFYYNISYLQNKTRSH